LVALSGGSDSVSLLRVLQELHYTCVAAHCNFQLRGSDSERDERFVTELCRDRAIPLYIKRFDTRAEAARRKVSIETAARDLRYAWFDALVNDEHVADCVALGHHRDDQAETVLLHLLRGSGIDGLQGMLPRRGYLVRPLLSVSREQIEEYLRRIGQAHVDDASNADEHYTRNRVRHTLFPLLETFNPAIRQRLAEMANDLRGVNVYYRDALRQAFERVAADDALDIPSLLREPCPPTVVWEYLRARGFRPTQAHDLWVALQSGVSGKRVVSPTGVRAIIDRERVVIDCPTLSDAPPFRWNMRQERCTPDTVIPTDPRYAYLDADTLPEGEWHWRRWQAGDRFRPLGMRGTKKVSDFLTDLKCSSAERENQWVLCRGNEIVWVVGRRIDNRYKCSPATRNLLIFMLNPPENQTI
jgi:tRNA(Ile)-lysidine synthase